MSPSFIRAYQPALLYNQSLISLTLMILEHVTITLSGLLFQEVFFGIGYLLDYANDVTTPHMRHY